MSDEAAPADAGANGTPPPDGAGTQQATPQAEPHVNHKEFIEYAKRVQSLEKLLKDQAPKPDSKGKAKDDSDLAAQVARLSRDLGFQKARADSGIAISNEAWGLLEKLSHVEQPENVNAWLAEKAKLFAPTSAPPKPTTNPSPAPPAPNTGAPAAGAAILPDDPMSIPADIWRTMGKEKRDEVMSKWMARGGIGNNAMFRKPAKK